MKKNVLYLYCVVIMAGIAACNGGQKEKSNKEKTETGSDQPVTANVTYSFLGGEDIVSLFEITVTYTDAEGNLVQDSITRLPWEKSVNEISSFPFDAKIIMNFTGKKDIPDKPVFHVGTGGGIAYQISDGRLKSSDELSTMSVGKDKISAYIEKMEGEKKYQETIK